MSKKYVWVVELDFGDIPIRMGIFSSAEKAVEYCLNRIRRMWPNASVCTARHDLEDPKSFRDYSHGDRIISIEQEEIL